jgi:hypothetical protein
MREAIFWPNRGLLTRLSDITPAKSSKAWANKSIRRWAVEPENEKGSFD